MIIMIKSRRMILTLFVELGACSSVVVKALWYKPEGLIPDEVNFKIYLILPATPCPGVTQPLTEMSTRNIKIIMFLGSKVWLVRRADNLTAICELIV
jgi:hypothetical protein